MLRQLKPFSLIVMTLLNNFRFGLNFDTKLPFDLIAYLSAATMIRQRNGQHPDKGIEYLKGTTDPALAVFFWKNLFRKRKENMQL